jgi:uncharacterized protein YraI
MLVTVVVAGSVALAASALARRAQVVRRALAAAATQDLRQSAIALARARVRADGGFRGPERLSLAAGAVQVRVDCDDGRPWVRVAVVESATLVAGGWVDPLEGLTCRVAAVGAEGR